MDIIRLEPNESGGYPPIWKADRAPDGCAEVVCDTAIFYEYCGFVIPTIENGIVTAFTANQEAYEATFPPPTAEELLAAARAEALNRIHGKCSAAIFSGVTIADKHYSLSLVSQQNLKTAQDKITAGATSVIFAADGEEPTVHTAEQITAISNAAYEWGVVNTSYYAKLQKWIARETDTAILNAIDYGSMLPNDLMSELATLLTGAGIDLAKYSTMIGG